MESTKALDPISELNEEAFAKAKKAFRDYQASWEGSIAKAICVYLTALAEQGEVAQPAAEGTAWLIELRGNVPSWWSLDPDEEPGWLRDADKALRFARREDAENYINDMGWNDVFATEHMWCTSPNGIASQEKGRGE